MMMMTMRKKNNPELFLLPWSAGHGFSHLFHILYPYSMKTIPNQKATAKKQADLTIEELKMYPGLEKLTDEQATEALANLKELSILLFYSFQAQINAKKPAKIRALEHKRAA